jgi:hypothetical protein
MSGAGANIEWLAEALVGSRQTDMESVAAKPFVPVHRNSLTPCRCQSYPFASPGAVIVGEKRSSAKPMFLWISPM